MNATTIHLALELRQRDDSLSGHVVGDHGKATFTGWLGLISTLDDLVRPCAGGDAPHDPTEPQGGTTVSTLETGYDLRWLRDRMRGAMLAAGEPGWDTARQAYNLVVEQTPELIALPADEQDVVAVVEFARENGLQVAPQRTGHNAEPLGSLEGVILLKTDGLIGVEIDVERRIARVGAGVKWGDVVPRASELGLAALHGSTPDVSVVGYSLGGGVGWYSRKLGLSANSVVAIELVTAEERCAASTRSTTPSSSGRSVGAAATSASSPRSRSGCFLSQRCTPACCSSRGSAPPRCCTRGTSGSRPCRTR